MIVTQGSTPTPESIVVLNALRAAVTKELDKKKRLGHYYVIWENDRVIFIGDDAPPHPQ
jgi:recombinational DNA repair protein RecT